MPIQELSQLRWLEQEISRDKERLEELEALALGGVAYDSRHLGGSDSHGKTERLGIEIAELKELIKLKHEQRIIEYSRLVRWVQDIEDSQTRQIFECRYVRGMTWNQVADIVDGGNTEDSVRKIASRYMETH